jgi:hypothetical protein
VFRALVERYLQGKTEVLGGVEEFYCHVFDHKFHMDGPGIERTESYSPATNPLCVYKILSSLQHYVIKYCHVHTILFSFSCYCCRLNEEETNKL